MNNFQTNIKLLSNKQKITFKKLHFNNFQATKQKITFKKLHFNNFQAMNYGYTNGRKKQKNKSDFIAASRLRAAAKRIYLNDKKQTHTNKNKQNTGFFVSQRKKYLRSKSSFFQRKRIY